MRLSFPTVASLCLCFAGVVFASSHDNSYNRKRHSGGLALRNENVNETAVLVKRGFTGPATYFADGLGACGDHSQPSDFIVAMNTAQYSNGAVCFQSITITCGTITNGAQVVDECPGCGQYGLDMSSGLFQAFAPLSVGEMTCEWSFGSAASSTPPPPPPPPPPAPTTSSTPPPPPPPTPSTTYSSSSSSTPTSSATTSASTSSATSTSGIQSSPSATSTSGETGSASPTTTGSTTTATGASYWAGTLNQLNIAVGSLGGVLVVGAR